MEICGGYWSDIGRRKVNQDAMVCRIFERDNQYMALCAVCDGVGGLEQGEVASGFLKGKIEEWFDTIIQWVDLKQSDQEVLFSHLKDAAEMWNEELWNLCLEKGIRSGSTMSLLLVVKDSYYGIHVGDSRIYCYLNQLERMTQDASVARVKAGRVKNYLDNFMGKSEVLSFLTLEGKLCGGEMFIICSDGLYHHMTEEDAMWLYQSGSYEADIRERCRQMADKMLERGEKDNISLVVVKVKKQEQENVEFIKQ